MKRTIVSWNVGGAKFLRMANTNKRTAHRKRLRGHIQKICEELAPLFVLVQEDVAFGRKDNYLVAPPNNYKVARSVTIDTDTNNHPDKWNPIRKHGNWRTGDYLAQANTLLWSDELTPLPIWCLSTKGISEGARLETEVVSLSTGLYNGTRDTEPRLALLRRFRFKGQDVYVVNVHFTTLSGEREGFPEIEARGDAIRRYQASVVLEGIVSRCNQWRERNHLSAAIWIVGGDLNALPSSDVVSTFEQRRFVNIAPTSTLVGTKRSKTGYRPELALDYVFAGIEHHAFGTLDRASGIESHPTLFAGVDNQTLSDHYPIVGEADLFAL